MKARAAFGVPARVIKCALAVAEGANKQSLAVRVGLHTGECDIVGESLGGFAVELAQKIAALSEDSNIPVSRTVKDLVAGSGLEFKEFGTRTFDGVEGKWRLFRVIQPKSEPPA